MVPNQKKKRGRPKGSKNKNRPVGPVPGQENLLPAVKGEVRGVGRPKMTQEMYEVRDLARDFSKRAIHRLAEIVESSDEIAAIRACEAILNRGFGRPALADTEGRAVPEAQIIVIPDNGRDDPRLIIEGVLDDAPPATH